MEWRRDARRLSVTAATVLGLAVVPRAASAHGVSTSRFTAPLPLPLLFAGAGATVGLTALWLTVTNRTGRSRNERRYVTTIPSGVVRRARNVASGLFLVAVLVVLSIGLVGRQVPVGNPATVFTWPVWFRGLALLAMLVGSPWTAISPWRTLYRGICRIEGRPLALLGRYPSTLGAWPALVGFLVLFGVIENLTVVPRSPRLTSVLLAVYALAMLGGAVLYGRTWLRTADPLGVLYGLFGRVAPLEVATDGTGDWKLTLRPPWDGCLEPVASGQLVVFVVAMVYTVSFDGFTTTRTFQATLFAVRPVVGTGVETSVVLYGVGLMGFVTAFALSIWLVERVGTGSGTDWLTAARWFAPTILPIAAAYEVAHNYPYVLGNLGRLLTMALNWSLPGIEPIRPLGWLSLPLFWGSQVALIVVGHVVAVVAAHYVAVDRYDTIEAARYGHVPLVVLMVGYTVLSLWIISQPVVAG